MNDKKTSLIYDQLVQFESANKHLNNYPIHKKLDLPVRNNGSEQKDIFDFIFAEFDFKKNINILDVGCGVGYGLLYLSKNLEAQGLGISLSSKEIGLANVNAKNLGLGNRCIFKKQHFDTLVGEKFDLIIALESLKHSEDLRITLPVLFGCLNDGGKMLIVEDFAALDIKDNDSLLLAYQSNWNLYDIYSLADYTDVIKENPRLKYSQVDLSPYTIKKNRILLTALHNFHKIMSRVPFSKISNLSKIYLGGTALELLYQREKMQYQILVIEKNHSS